MKRLSLIASAVLLAPSALAQTPAHPADHTEHEQHQPKDPPPADPHAGHGMNHGVVATGEALAGAFGDYPIARDGSGTSWIPDAAGSGHGGLHGSYGDWMLMGHVVLDGVYSWQDGPRGDEKLFPGGMLMGSARGEFAGGSVQLRAMLSPDPLMGKSGYPLLLASGETADGIEPLIDRQHPHDFFMELSASYAVRVAAENSLFVYAGLPGEPAFGPPAFMHRPAAMPSPEAPITHHWFDSTHITFGVLTAGWVHHELKLEASRFRGREPDENRYDIETGELDSTAVRLSWNPSPHWALQASWADVKSPELLDPDLDQTRWSASALYSRPLQDGGAFSFTGAFARKDSSDGVELDAWLGEASWSPDGVWTFFTRAEAIETDELGVVHHGPIEDVAKLSIGLVRDFRVSEHVTLALGALVSHNWVSDALSPLYDGDPMGGMAFVRLKIG
jgi:hypothetical protein